MATPTRTTRRPSPRTEPRRRPFRRPARQTSTAEAAGVTGTAAPAPKHPVRARRRRRAHTWDNNMFLVITLLQCIGLIALFSASYSNGLYYHGSPVFFIRQQAINAAIGFIAMIFISKVNYRVYEKGYKILMYLSIVLLILVAIPGIGTVRNKARRWLFGFQPSELAKLTVIVCFAYWVSKAPSKIRTIKGLIYPYGALLLVYMGLLYLEPHTSAMMIICGIGVVILIAAGMKLWYFPPIVLLGAGAVFIFYRKYEHVQTRFEVWLDPFIDVVDKGFQGAMSQIAIGSGGLFGYGLGLGRQKHLYLPEPQNDFIFASWCEEMGLIGALMVIILFAYLIFRGFTIARAAPDTFSTLLATGITVKLAIQTLMNLFVVTGIMPVTGASLPFFSYGGTALMMQLGEMGILLNISRFMRIDARSESSG